MLEALTVAASGPSADQKKAYKTSTAAKQRVREEPAFWGAVPPAKYASKYPPLPEMKAANGLSDAFANGSAMHNVPLVTRKSVTILPRMYSFDPRVLALQRETADELDRVLRVDVDERGFTRTGIHTTFQRLKTAAGYVMNPMSYTTVDNAEYRKELGLSPGYTPRQRAIAREVWDNVWREVKMTKVKVAKLSQGGGRRFTFDVQWKLAFCEWLLEPGNFETMLDAVDNDDWETLANRFETLYFTYYQKRLQVDSIGSKRTVFDLEYALSGGKRGKSFDADKRVIIDGVTYPDFSAMRARVVHAGPWAVNCFLQMCASPAMRALFVKFPETFHVNTKEQISSVVNGKHITCSDVKEYDRSMSWDAIDVAHESMREYFDPRIVKASLKLFTCPYYARPLSLDGRRGTWVGDPRKPGERVFAGNRSGHALTSLMAKVNKVIETLFLFDRIYPVLGRTSAFLKGDMPMGMVNNGDDEVIWARSKIDLDAYLKLREDPANGHYLVEEEVGQGFSGLLLKKVGDTEYDPVPRVHTTYEKMLCPERSIGGKHRAFWAIGAMARIDNVMSTDVGRESWSIFLSVYKRTMEYDFGSILDLIKEGLDQIPIDIHGLTLIDKAVLEDPDKLHYMYDDTDVSSSAVLDQVTSNVPVEQVEKFLNRYYTGHII